MNIKTLQFKAVIEEIPKGTGEEYQQATCIHK